MPWTIDDPPPVAQNWPIDEQRRCVAAANSTLEETGDEEQAIFACISAAGRSEEGETESATMKPEMERKYLQGVATKIDTDQGIVEHTVAVMGNTDLGGDVIHNGAFTKTITERMGQIKVLDSHNSWSLLDVIGKPLAMWEVDRNGLPETIKERFPNATGALMARTQFLMDTPEGKGAFLRIKSGAVDQYSIGYDALDVDFESIETDDAKINIRNLRTLKLWEYSPVTFAMNPATSTVGVKAAEDKGVNGAMSLPLASRDREWDSTVAERRVRSWADAEDEPNAQYQRGFFWFDSDAADQFGSYKLSFADVIDGELHAIPRGLFAVAAVLQGARGGVEIPEADQQAIKGRVGTYYAKMRTQFDDDSIVPPWDKAAEPETEQKVGRAISARNATRIQGAIDNAQAALADLEQMLAEVGVTEQAPEEEEASAAVADFETAAALAGASKPTPQPDVEAVKDQDHPTEQAGPDEDSPTSSDMMLAIDQHLKEINSLLEVT